jgi:hypothetical protein
MKLLQKKYYLTSTAQSEPPHSILKFQWIIFIFHFIFLALCSNISISNSEEPAYSPSQQKYSIRKRLKIWTSDLNLQITSGYKKLSGQHVNSQDKWYCTCELSIHKYNKITSPCITSLWCYHHSRHKIHLQQNKPSQTNPVHTLFPFKYYPLIYTHISKQS